jgi:hypothetical protein
MKFGVEISIRSGKVEVLEGNLIGGWVCSSFHRWKRCAQKPFQSRELARAINLAITDDRPKQVKRLATLSTEGRL